ncbi:Ricin-type beta-trefoil lectin domain protein [Mycobacterium basiliense]|uniref:Ricin-type beta-trefoil lectin domain protein n=1 Tax=Mycobacterium basiliense TaxID=2094119 RepID=A0A3S4BG47_9MYCO|nr:RICIN domain-containing protein [Mycobacterium basiliense]VDM89881.1 Ricin-type beta-trefoil lectin domain protein [Mycobacterium basiliense]
MYQTWMINGVRRALVFMGTVFVVAVLGIGQAKANGPVQLKSRLGDACLDAPSGSWITPVVVKPCNGTDFQRWNLTDAGQLESVSFPGECLNAPGQSWVVHLQPCIDWISQHWSIQPNGHVTSELGGCLTVLGGPDPGTWVSNRFCSGNADQGWDSVP